MKKKHAEHQLELFGWSQPPLLLPPSDFLCARCDDSRWDFKDRPPPFPPCPECTPPQASVLPSELNARCSVDF